MRNPFFPDRPRSAPLDGPPGRDDDLLTLESDGAESELDVIELEAILPEEDTLQEVAEQTPYGEILLEDLMRRQLRLALSVAAAFLVSVFGLPLMNLVFPELVQVRVLGLPLHWVAVAVLVYPLLWVLAAYFVSTSRKYEDEFTELVK